ncbi:MAG TPA: TetR family transcriptional regulator [Acidimicrobiia bacterium]
MAPSTPSTRARAPRADALRNREAVLVAARRVLAAGGLDAPVDDVAAAAGVGVATVYRHFPTKTALVDAVIERSFEELTREAEAAAAGPDAGAAFLGFVRHAGVVMARDRVLVAAARSTDRPERSPVVQRLFDAAGVLLRRAIAAGAVRGDVVADDLPALLVGAGDAANQRGRPTPAALERYLDIITQGLRAGRATAEPAELR